MPKSVTVGVEVTRSRGDLLDLSLDSAMDVEFAIGSEFRERPSGYVSQLGLTRRAMIIDRQVEKVKTVPRKQGLIIRSLSASVDDAADSGPGKRPDLSLVKARP